LELKFEEDWNEKKGRAKEMQLTWENSNLAEAHRKKARQEGKKEGKKEGIKEEKVAVAQKMLLKGMEIPFVMEITDLSEEEVEDIKKEIF
jgi:predicted transposase/invertase (TIGR01784 family)